MAKRNAPSPNRPTRKLRKTTCEDTERSRLQAQEEVEVREERAKQVRRRANRKEKEDAERLEAEENEQNNRNTNVIPANHTDALLQACEVAIKKEVDPDTEPDTNGHQVQKVLKVDDRKERAKKLAADELEENNIQNHVLLRNLREALLQRDFTIIDPILQEIFNGNIEVENALEVARGGTPAPDQILNEHNVDVALEKDERTVNRKHTIMAEEELPSKRVRTERPCKHFVLFSVHSGTPTLANLIGWIRVLIYEQFGADDVYHYEMVPVSGSLWAVRFGASGVLLESLDILLGGGEAVKDTLHFLNQVEYGAKTELYLTVIESPTFTSMAIPAFLLTFARVKCLENVFIQNESIQLRDNTCITLQSLALEHPVEADQACQQLNESIRTALERHSTWTKLRSSERSGRKKDGSADTESASIGLAGIENEKDPIIGHQTESNTNTDAVFEAPTRVENKSIESKKEADPWSKLMSAEYGASLLKTHMSEELYDKFKAAKTRRGTRLIDCLAQTKIGFWVPDAEAYSLFAPLFNVITEDYYRVPLPARHPPSKFEEHGKKLKAVDPKGRFVKYARIECSRNIKSHRFVPQLSGSELVAVEEEMKNVFNSFTDRALQGKYYPLNQIPVDVQRMLLESRTRWNSEDDDTAKARDLTGRGVFVNEKKTLMIFVNHGNHVRIVVEQSGGDLGTLMLLLSKAVYALRKKVPFLHHSQLGWLTTDPANLGPATCASVIAELPIMSQDRKFKEICQDLEINAVPMSNESIPLIYKLCRKPRLGLSEIEIVSSLYGGTKALVTMEKTASEDA